MTKVSVFGQQPTEQPKELKKIEFVKRIHSDGTLGPNITAPKDWDNVVLYRAAKSADCFDLILAFDDNNGMRAVFLGHWNDGVVAP